MDITPPLGTHLAGAVGTYRPAQGVLDPLYARALVLQGGGKRMAVLALDVTIVTAEYTAAIREAAARLGFSAEAVMVHATQTHSAPALGYFMLDEGFPELPGEFEWVRGSEAAYSDFAAGRAVEALKQAVASLGPAEVGAASGIEGRLAFNRRAVRRDGTVAMPGRRWEGPLGPTWICYIEGPIDPELGVVALRRPDGAGIGLIVNYACHPVHVFPRPLVSADWPGALSEALEEQHGEDCLALVLNGACGNINPWPPFDPDYVEDHRRMGTQLAEVVANIVKTIEFSRDVPLDWRLKRLEIPIREVPHEEVRAAEDLLRRKPQPWWAGEEPGRVDPQWMAAASLYSVHLMRQRQETLEYEVQVLRVGDVALVGLPGEPFVELGLQIKMASPARLTYLAHCTSQYVGYIPTREALARGGHEVNTQFWAKLVPEAGEMIVQATVEALEELFR